MSRDPWTDPDPQPGDLDAELELLDDSAFEFHEGDPSATFGLMVVVEGEDASRLARIADAREQKPSETLAELLREADRPAAWARRHASGPKHEDRTQPVTSFAQAGARFYDM